MLHDIRNHPGADNHHGAQKYHRLDRGNAENRKPGFGILKLWQNDHQRHHGKILHNEHADHDPAGQGAEPPLVFQGF